MVHKRCLKGVMESTLSNSNNIEAGLPISDDPDTRHEKEMKRREVKRRLKLLQGEEMDRQSQIVTHKVLHEYRLLDDVKALTIFIACRKLKEVDTSEIMKMVLGEDGADHQQRKVFLPRVLDRDSNMHFLQTWKGDSYETVPPFGIQEPTMHHQDGSLREDILELDVMLDAMFMPGLAFSKDGKRLGRGGGYYDTFIDKYLKHMREKNWSKEPLLIALAFNEQVIDDVPMDAHDQPVDIIVTADEVYGCTKQGRDVLRKNKIHT